MPWKKILSLRSVTGFWEERNQILLCMWSRCGGRRVEVGGRCGLMEAGVCEREGLRLCERERVKEACK